MNALFPSDSLDLPGDSQEKIPIESCIMRFDFLAGFGLRNILSANTTNPRAHAARLGWQRGVRAGVALALATVFLGSAQPVFAEGGSVRYFYELIELAGDNQYGLVPVSEQKKLSGKLSKSKVFDAFNLLKDKKKSTYGHSSIKITGNLPGSAQISVKIDSAMAKAGFAPIIMAETVYTLSELGVIGGVEFPGHFSGKMTRSDVPFYAYTLTLPLWRALPLKDYTGAQVLLPDGTLLPATQFNTRWKASDAELHAALFSYLKSSDEFTVIQVLALLPTLKLDYRDHVLPLLESPSTRVRGRALSTLEKHRDDALVLAAVEKMMNTDKDATLARSAAAFLGKSKAAEAAVQEPLYVLEKGAEADSVAAVKSLETIAHKNAGLKDKIVGALVNHLVDKRATVATASSDALEALGADAEQIAALENTQITADLRLKIARQLANKSQATSAIVGHTYVATHLNERDAELAIRKLGAIKDDAARQAVEKFLAAETSRKRRVAGEVLAERADIAALPALSGAIAKGKDVPQLEASAYALMAAQPVATVLSQSDSTDPVIKRIAYRALGELAVKSGGNAQVKEKLIRGAANADTEIRGASASALGAFASPDGLEVITKLADDKSVNVRVGVAQGLAYYKGGEGFEILEKYLDDSSPLVVAASLDAMAARAEAAKWGKIRELAESKDAGVRASAFAALGTLVSADDKQGVNTVISLLSGAVSDSDPRVQITALEQLATIKDPKVTTGIAILLNAKEPALRVAAVEALGNTGQPSAVELVVSVLDDANPDIRRAAVEALGDLKASAAKTKLQARLEVEKDADLKALIKQTLSRI